MTVRLALLTFAAAGLSAVAAQAQTDDAVLIGRGMDVAAAADCKPCHTITGRPPFSGGRPIDTPFGVIISANITPDNDTGIGTWSEADFARALRQGKSRRAGHLYPAMPYPYFSKMSDDDIHALYTYLRTVPAVQNTPDRSHLPFPFNIRFLMTFWNMLFFKHEPVTNDPQKPADWNRGAYLVQGPGHCGACHTPKNFLGGDKGSHALQGATLQYWRANDLTANTVTGLGSWTLDDLTTYLKTGHNRFGAAGASMAEVVTNSTSRMPDTDIHAIAVYLKGLPARDEKAAARVAENDPAMQVGQALYVDNCTACHGKAADGASELFPMLKDNPAVRATDPTSLIRVVLEGAQSAPTDTNPSATAMPSFGWKLNDSQIAAVLTYVRNSWNNSGSAVSEHQVAAVRRKLPRPN
jgi:mono/diheme cytochrome c family protein